MRGEKEGLFFIFVMSNEDLEYECLNCATIADFLDPSLRVAMMHA